MTRKKLLTEVFEKMGPDAVERMLIAFGPRGALNYCQCALGWAAGYGEDTEERLNNDCGRADLSFIGFLAQRLNITLQEAEVVEDAHFCRRYVKGKRFVALANEWLENRPVVNRPDEPGVIIGHLESVSR